MRFFKSKIEKRWQIRGRMRITWYYFLKKSFFTPKFRVFEKKSKNLQIWKKNSNLLDGIFSNKELLASKKHA